MKECNWLKCLACPLIIFYSRILTILIIMKSRLKHWFIANSILFHSNLSVSSWCPFLKLRCVVLQSISLNLNNVSERETEKLCSAFDCVCIIKSNKYLCVPTRIYHDAYCHCDCNGWSSEMGRNQKIAFYCEAVCIAAIAHNPWI